MDTDDLFASGGAILPVGVGVLLVLSALGGVAQGSVASNADASVDSAVDGSPLAVQDGANNTTVQQGVNNTTDVTISIVRAMETAQNETNGTSVGAELKRKGNVTDLERPSRVYEVDVLAANGTHFVVDVNATDGSVRQAQTSDNETGFFEGLLGNDDEDEVVDRNVNLSEIRSGGEAVEVAQNETEDNRTVTTVELTSRNETLVYDIELVTEEGARSTVSVAADPADGDVLSNETTEEGTEELLG